MKCYVCKHSGQDTDAIAICIVCGMALCKDHQTRADIDMWEGGYPLPPQRMKKKIPRVLCHECSDAMIK
jgi:hypothetical protein